MLKGKDCNKCVREACNLKYKQIACSEYMPPVRTRFNMVEVAAFRELMQTGEIKVVSTALSKRRLMG